VPNSASPGPSIRKRLLDCEFAAPPRTDVRRPRLGIGADAGDEHEASDAELDRLPRHNLGALHVHGLEGHATLLDIGRDRIDDGVGPGNCGGDRCLVAHIGADERDLIWVCHG
jgi:hypothetical protein